MRPERICIGFDLTASLAAVRRGQLGDLRVVTFLMATLMAASVASAQNFLVNGAPIAGSSIRRTVDGLTAQDITSRMIENDRVRREHLQSYSALRRYEIVNANGQVSAEALVRVDYHSPGRKTFEKISEDGSWMVRKWVFDRLLQSEEATSYGQEWREAAISEENYIFAVVGEADLAGNHCYVVEAQPKRADKYLFRGELWIDARDFGIVKISGRPASKMSLWINQVEFVREYQKVDGFWLPYRDETVVNMKVHGTKVLRIERQQYVINSRNKVAVSESAFAQTR